MHTDKPYRVPYLSKKILHQLVKDPKAGTCHVACLFKQCKRPERERERETSSTGAEVIQTKGWKVQKTNYTNTPFSLRNQSSLQFVAEAFHPFHPTLSNFLIFSNTCRLVASIQFQRVARSKKSRISLIR